MKLRFDAKSEPWTEYLLEDGTVVRVRVIMVRANRREGQFNDHGAPVYDLEMQQIMHVDPAAEVCHPVHTGPATKQ